MLLDIFLQLMKKTTRYQRKLYIKGKHMCQIPFFFYGNIQKVSLVVYILTIWKMALL
uniref:Uncharacterized protein n=1 Tax=Lepeophtheirus salmonis TaxID=72036 RepID=A0A0K2TYY7_LEPSM